MWKGTKREEKGLPIPPLLLILDDDEAEESLEAKVDGFSMIREFDKLSFRVKLEMVRSLDWTEGTWWLPVIKSKRICLNKEKYITSIYINNLLGDKYQVIYCLYEFGKTKKSWRYTTWTFLFSHFKCW